MCRTRPAFTLVEILIVVIILGILAAIVVPRLSDVTTISRETNLKENLSKIRANIQVYRNEHAAFPSPSSFGQQLTKPTDYSGEVAVTRDTTHRFGPYLEQMPANPVTGQVTVRAASGVSERFPPGDIDGGWWFNEITGEFYADLKGSHVDGAGNPYSRY